MFERATGCRVQSVELQHVRTINDPKGLVASVMVDAEIGGPVRQSK